MALSIQHNNKPYFLIVAIFIMCQQAPEIASPDRQNCSTTTALMGDQETQGNSSKSVLEFLNSNAGLLTAELIFDEEFQQDKAARTSEPSADPDSLHRSQSALVYFYKEGSGADSRYKAKIWTSKTIDVYSGFHYQIALYNPTPKDKNSKTNYTFTIPIDLDSNALLYSTNRLLKEQSVGETDAVLKDLYGFGYAHFRQNFEVYTQSLNDSSDPLCKTPNASSNAYCVGFINTQVITGTVNTTREKSTPATSYTDFIDKNYVARVANYKQLLTANSDLVKDAQMVATLTAYLEELQLQYGYYPYFTLTLADNVKTSLGQSLTFTYDTTCTQAVPLPTLMQTLKSAASSSQSIKQFTACLRWTDNRGANDDSIFLPYVELGDITLGEFNSQSNERLQYLYFIDQVINKTIAKLTTAYANLYKKLKVSSDSHLFTHANLFKQGYSSATPPAADQASIDVEYLAFDGTLAKPSATNPAFNLYNPKWLESSNAASPPKLIYSYAREGNNNFNYCVQSGSMISFGGLIPLQTLALFSDSACDEQGGGIQNNIPQVDDPPPVPSDPNQEPDKPTVDKSKTPKDC